MLYIMHEKPMYAPLISGSLLAFILTVSSFGADSDSIPFRHHKIQIDPISLIGGSFAGNYECRINPVHAFAIQGAYTMPRLGNSAFAAGIQYRRYYSPVSFWGIFANEGEMTLKIPPFERGDTTTYSFDLSYLTIGADWGKNWYIKKRFPIIFGIGAGIPVKSDLTWKNNVKPTMASTFEAIFLISTAIDLELTIGVNF
jgi:hypothetical protein